MRFERKKAVVLLSGGLDSATVLYYARKKGYECHCLLFDYGQRHRRELNAALRIAAGAGCNTTTVTIRLPWDTSSLVDRAKSVPSQWLSLKKGRLPSTYVPGRNTIFISYALSFAETIGADRIFIGANALDFSGYPDCRPVYYTAWSKVLKALGTSIKIETPLIDMTKARIIRLGLKLGTPYALTWSCYQGKGKPCGVCDSCRIRARGFQEAGEEDPALAIRRRRS